MHQLRMSPLRPFSGWTKIPSSLPDFFFFFSTSSLPLNFPPSYLPPTSPLLPTTYQPLPLTPSPELLAPETLSGSELGAWSRVGAGASLEFGTSLELGATAAGPTQDPGKHFSLCCFLFVLQEKKKKKKAIASPSSSSLCRGAYNASSERKLRRAPELAATQAPELRSFSGACISFMQQALSPGELRSLPSSKATQAPSNTSSGACCSSRELRATRAPELAAAPESSEQRELRSLLQL
jgi:hypothetical protein